MKKRLIALLLVCSMSGMLMPSIGQAAEGTPPVEAGASSSEDTPSTQAVAQVGNATYTTLEDAYNAVNQAGTGPATITLLADVTVASKLPNLQASVTIIGGGHTLTLSDTLTITTTGSLTLDNCQLEINNVAGYGILNSGKLALQNNTRVHISGCGTGIYTYGNLATVIVDHSTLDCSNNSINGLWHEDGWGTLVLKNKAAATINANKNGGIIANLKVNVDDSSLTINNNKANAMNGSYLTATNATIQVNNNGAHGLSVTDIIATNSKIETNGNAYRGISVNKAGTVAIDGGTITANENGQAELDPSNTHPAAGICINGIKNKNPAVFKNGVVITLKDNHAPGLESYRDLQFGEDVSLEITGNEVIQNHSDGTDGKGGGLFAFKHVTLPQNTKIYNNRALIEGDDVYVYEGSGQLTLPPVGAAWTLRDCGHAIDGWYEDNEGARWQCATAENAVKLDGFDATTGVATIVGPKALKAAHGALPPSPPPAPPTPPASPMPPTPPIEPEAPETEHPNAPHIPENLNVTEHYAYMVGRPDGYFYPEAPITRGEVAAIFFRLLTDEARNTYWRQQNSFNDVPETLWCSNAISTLSNMGILHGYTDGGFHPQAPITRAEYAKIAVSFYDVNLQGYNGSFKDVPDNQWYTPYVETASMLGIVDGFEDASFHPVQHITRAEACAITNKAILRAPRRGHLLPAEQMLVWPDNPVDAWYYLDVQEATNGHQYTYEDNQEVWTAPLPPRDWAALEQAWADALSQ